MRQVVSLLDEDILLIVLGDYGIDRAGDRRGDGVLDLFERETFDGYLISSSRKGRVFRIDKVYQFPWVQEPLEVDPID